VRGRKFPNTYNHTFNHRCPFTKRDHRLPCYVLSALLDTPIWKTIVKWPTRLIILIIYIDTRVYVISMSLSIIIRSWNPEYSCHIQSVVYMTKVTEINTINALRRSICSVYCVSQYTSIKIVINLPQ